MSTNPWRQTGIREVERARDLWSGCQSETAALVLRGVAPRVPHQRRFEAVAELADSMAARHRLDFKEVVKKLGIVRKSLPQT